MAEIKRYKDCGVSLAEDCSNILNDDYYYDSIDKFINTPFGKRILFNSDDSSEIDTNTTHDFIQQTGICTIAFKVKLLSSNNYQRFLWGISGTGFRVEKQVDAINFKIGGTGGVVIDATVSNIFTDLDSIHSIVITADGSSARFYINDNDVYVRNMASGNLGGSQLVNTTISNDSPFCIDGWMSDVIIDERCWTAEEAEAYHNNTMFDYDKNIISNWHMDNTSELEDVSPNATPRIYNTTNSNQYFEDMSWDIDSLMEDGIWDFEIDFNYDSSNRANYGRLLWFYNTVSNSFFRIQRGLTTDTWIFWVRNDDGDNIVSQSFTLTPDSDIKLRIVSDGENSKVYINGELQMTTSLSTGNLFTPSWTEKRILSNINSQILHGIERVKLTTSNGIVFSMTPIKAGEERSGVTATENGLFDSISHNVYGNAGLGDSFSYAKGNNAYQADGETTLIDGPNGNKALNFPYDSDFNTGQPVGLLDSDELTLMHYVKWDNTYGQTYNTLLGFWGTAPEYGRPFLTRCSGNRFSCYFANSEESYTNISMYNVTDKNVWNVITATLSPDGVNIYYNGDFEKSSSTPYYKRDYVTSNLYIGSLNGGTAKWDGDMSNIIIFNKALTQMQIRDVENRMRRGQI